MTERLPKQDASPEPVPLVEGTDWLDEFPLQPETSPPERQRSADSTDELDAFAATPAVDDVRTDAAAKQHRPPRFGWMTAAFRVALVCSVLAAAAGAALMLQTPPAARAAFEPEPAPLLSPAVEPPLAMSPAVLESAPVASPTVETTTQPSDVRSVPGVTAPSEPPRTPAPAPAPRPSAVEPGAAPVVARDMPAEDTAAAAVSSPPATTPAAARLLAPDVTTSPGIPPPAVDTAPVVAGAGATSSPPAETARSTSTDVAEQAAAGPSFRELETVAIEHVLERYRDAFNRLDASAASAVWPTVNEKTLASAFERLNAQNVSFSGCQIVLGDATAEATCIGIARFEPSVGNRETTPEVRRWRFSLQKSGGAWLIDRVDMR